MLIHYILWHLLQSHSF